MWRLITERKSLLDRLNQNDSCHNCKVQIHCLVSLFKCYLPLSGKVYIMKGGISMGSLLNKHIQAFWEVSRENSIEWPLCSLSEASCQVMLNGGKRHYDLGRLCALMASCIATKCRHKCWCVTKIAWSVIHANFISGFYLYISACAWHLSSENSVIAMIDQYWAMEITLDTFMIAILKAHMVCRIMYKYSLPWESTQTAVSSTDCSKFKCTDHLGGCQVSDPSNSLIPNSLIPV